MISKVTEGEIRAFARLNNWKTQKLDSLEILLGNLIVVDLSMDGVVDSYANIDHFLKSQKPALTIGQNDIWIAALAQAIGGHLITTDRDFLKIETEIKLHFVDTKSQPHIFHDKTDHR